jgi:hypothetical protein
MQPPFSIQFDNDNLGAFLSTHPSPSMRARPPPRSEEHYIVQKSTDGVDLAWYIIRWCGAVAFLLSPLTNEPATTSGVAWPWRGVAFSYFHSRNR